ncbi:MAG: glycosyl transferase family 1 [Bdellovibrionales bacterium]|nr:glycosyl transferase family 1 [Bdellovibrionales bacterium]
MIARKRRILFVAEDTTLAQIVRLRVLADTLDPHRYEIHFACQQFPDLIFSGSQFVRWPIYSLSPETVLTRAESGTSPYDISTLAKYVEADLHLLDAVQPDLVVGDLRLSLAVSAEYKKIPFATLINAYWSRGWQPRPYPLPDHPTVRWFGTRIAGFFYPLARPFVFRSFAAPLNRLRKRYGLSTIGNLQDVLTYGTYTLYPDTPGLIPLPQMSSTERFLGPVLWSPALELPTWWEHLRRDKPLIYLTLGSSGNHRVLPTVVDALADLPVEIAVSTAGKTSEHSLNAFTAPYLPGDKLCEHADLVICNGGATTAYQALYAGKPVIGIPSNLDQFLSAAAIQGAGAGRWLRTSEVKDLKTVAAQLLEDSQARKTAKQLRQEFLEFRSDFLFPKFVGSHFG